MSTPPNNKPSSFGIPGVNIKPTLSDYYDPYSGINMTIQDSCSHVEVMTLPLGVVSEVEARKKWIRLGHFDFCPDGYSCIT